MGSEQKKPPVEEIKRQLAILLNYHRLAVRSADAALRRAISEVQEAKSTQ